MRSLPEERLKRRQRDMRKDKLQRGLMWSFISVVVVVSIIQLF